jgi:hypothetical protein
VKKKEKMADCLWAICLSQLLRNWLFFFLEPKGVLSFFKKKEGACNNAFIVGNQYCSLVLEE